MSVDLEEIKKEYTETLKRNGEIEFSYENHFYHIEPSSYDEKDKGFDIWQFSNSDGDDAKKIAEHLSIEAVLEEKAFNGKTILEIENDMADCILR